jgi:phosphate starvation-inducible protein PhoH
MKTMWRAEADMTAPKQVEAEPWPGKDADGVSVYTNTHFATVEDAWESLLSERAAHVAIAGRTVTSARRELRQAEEEAGRAAELFSEAQENFERWKREARR